MLLSCWINKSTWSSTTRNDLYLSCIINFCTLDSLEFSVIDTHTHTSSLTHIYVCMYVCILIELNPIPFLRKQPKSFKWIFWMLSRVWMDCHSEISSCSFLFIFVQYFIGGNASFVRIFLVSNYFYYTCTIHVHINNKKKIPYFVYFKNIHTF